MSVQEQEAGEPVIAGQRQPCGTLHYSTSFFFSPYHSGCFVQECNVRSPLSTVSGSVYGLLSLAPLTVFSLSALSLSALSESSLSVCSLSVSSLSVSSLSASLLKCRH